MGERIPTVLYKNAVRPRTCGEKLTGESVCLGHYLPR